MSKFLEHLKLVQEGSTLENINEDDPRLVDKNVPNYVPDKVCMEDAPMLIDKSFSEYVDVFLAAAEVIHKTLEAETHKHQYQLIGNTISVAIRRLPYIKLASNLKRENDEYTKNIEKNEALDGQDRDEGQVEQTEGSTESS